MKISHIVATDLNSCIGNNNELPWKQKADMKFFRQTTTNNVIIVGRTTFESFGSKPLPNRINIVLTSNPQNYVSTDSLHFVDNIDKAISLGKTFNKNIFIIGGGQIYSQTLDLVDTILLTKIDTIVNGDTFYPEVDKMINFRLLESWETHQKDENNQFDYKFLEYSRII